MKHTESIHQTNPKVSVRRQDGGGVELTIRSPTLNQEGRVRLIGLTYGYSQTKNGIKWGKRNYQIRGLCQ